MSTQEQEKALDRIRKLLKIAKDDAAMEGEIQNAMNAVACLMDRHHLTEEDLKHEPADDYQKVDEAEKGLYRAWIGTRVYMWEDCLARFIQDFVGCMASLDNQLMFARHPNGMLKRDKYERPYKSKSFCFYGVAEDAQIAQELYEELHLTISTMAYSKFNSAYGGDGADYCGGFVTALQRSYTEHKRQEKLLAHDNDSSTALLVIERRSDLMDYKQKAAVKYLEDVLGLKTTTRRRGYGPLFGNHEAWRQGMVDGYDMDVEVDRKKKLT